LKQVLKTVAVFTVAVAVMAGCGDKKSNGNEVQWSDYAASVRIRIDDYIARKECVLLQTESQNAGDDGAATKRRTGHDDSALQAYIQAGLKTAGCDKSQLPTPLPPSTTNPKRSAPTGIPAHEILDRALIGGGTDVFVDILIPTLAPGDPAVAQVCEAIARQEGAVKADCYSTKDARQANLSASFGDAHPGALEVGFLGGWAAATGFTAPV
jgi:hypothetical protein